MKKILISMISNKPDVVQRWFSLNSSVIFSYNTRMKDSKIEVMINWNNLDKIPTINHNGITVHEFLVDPLIRNGEYHWNTTRFKNVEKVEFDYLHMIDDDTAFSIYNAEQLYGPILEENVEFVKVTSDKLVLTDYDDMTLPRKVLNSPVKLKLRRSISNLHKLLSGGHIMSKDFIAKYIGVLTDYDEFNDDTYRCWVAMKYSKCYHTSRRTFYYTYLSSNYNPEDRVKSVNRFNELGINVKVNLYGSVSPVVENYELDGYTNVVKNVYKKKGQPDSYVVKRLLKSEV